MKYQPKSVRLETTSSPHHETIPDITDFGTASRIELYLITLNPFQGVEDFSQPSHRPAEGFWWYGNT